MYTKIGLMLTKQTEKELKAYIREDGLLGIGKYDEDHLREWLGRIEERAEERGFKKCEKQWFDFLNEKNKRKSQ